ncbi:MAG: methionyl-tRNA formyltransferase [Minisyncoccia bacterium]|jgi:methionyl-tRNA formyltransferase
MKYIFFGTPEFATIILEKLIGAGFAPAGVVCNPDRPVGRKKITTPPPTKLLAQKHGIPVLQPEKLNEPLDTLGAAFAIVAAYAKIIPESVLKMFPKGIIGIHPSLLPRYRGATPIQSAMLAGEEETGVTLYLMDEKVDHGAILLSDKLRITDNDTYETLGRKLAELSAVLTLELLPKFLRGELKPMPQNESQATFTKKFNTDYARVDPEKDDPVTVERKIRALNPEPGVWTIENGKRVKLLKAELSGGKLILKTIQVEGKKPKDIQRN